MKWLTTVWWLRQLFIERQNQFQMYKLTLKFIASTYHGYIEHTCAAELFFFLVKSPTELVLFFVISLFRFSPLFNFIHSFLLFHVVFFLLKLFIHWSFHRRVHCMYMLFTFGFSKSNTEEHDRIIIFFTLKVWNVPFLRQQFGVD